MAVTRPPLPLRRSLTLLAGTVVLAVAGCAPSGGTPSPSPAAAVVPSASPSGIPSVAPSASPSVAPSPTPSASPAADVVPADLDGVLVAPELAHRLPLAVMIDDSRAARPQSGFNAASIVYQATADGYESRYMLVFQEGDTTAIGPVRSARFFLVQWAQEAGAAIAHYGGDRRTRTYIRYSLKPSTDVDGLGRGNPAYHRIKTRTAPHNAYTSTIKLRARAIKLGAPATFGAKLFVRPVRDASAPAERGTSQSIRIPYHTNTVSYVYDPVANVYRRSINGKPHIDPADDQQVTTTNIVVLFQKFRIDTKIEKGHSRPDIKTLGTGKAIVFLEGHRIAATWKKKSDKAPTRLYDASGQEIPLVRGRTFIQSVPLGTKVTVKD
jgi:hypothetical protein